MFDVAVVGSVNLDLVATAPRLPGPGETVSGTAYAEYAGGKGLNQSVAAARSGASVALIGAVGDDDAGRRLRALAEAEGIDVSSLAVVEIPTGRALITVDARAENSIVVVPGANALVPVDAVVDARVVIAQLEIPIETVIAAFRSARRRGGCTILNPAPARSLPDELLEVCDIVIPNEHELELVGGLDALLDRGVSTVVTTLGAAGVDVVDVVDGASRAWNQAAFTVSPVDTTGAGDAFCGALAARLASGDELPSALRYAAAAGALATTSAGAVASLPHAEDIDRMLASTGG
ncbi:MAG TPA: ribokinase [Ilumatobacteraceae bacterium]|nr:ribokinase [Ilumatobacteraceae bacterium]